MQSVSYLGIKGSFSFSAAHKYLPASSTKYVGCNNFEKIFQNVKEKKSDYGVIPIENSLAGSIYENYDLLETYPVHVVKELYIKVQHTLVGAKNSDISLVKEVHSHQKALEQCSVYLSNLTNISTHPFSDTANAAKYVAEKNKPHIAAVSSILTATLYDLKVLKENIEDNPNNFTRFLVIANEDSKIASGLSKNKCSLIIKLSHQAGSLFKLFKTLADFNCNVTKIESRPQKDHPFEYTFYLDFCFDPAIFSLTDILSSLAPSVEDVTLLGAYKHQEKQFATE